MVRIHSHKYNIGCHKFGASAPGAIEIAPASQIFILYRYRDSGMVNCHREYMSGDFASIKQMK